MNAGKRSGSHAPQRGPGLPSRCPRSRLAHLGVAADAARRVGAGLGAHSQRARPVEAQAALAGRQESGQVLVARERLRAVASPAAGERGESLSARAHARGCRMPRGRARGDGRDPRPPAPAHLAHGRDAADVHRVGARAERHAERPIAREEDVVVAAGHALGVHGEEAVRLDPGAPRVRVKPGEAVGIAEEQRGACAGAHQPTETSCAQCSPRPALSNHAPNHACLSHPGYKPGPSRLLQC